mgnify:FL=1
MLSVPKKLKFLKFQKGKAFNKVTSSRELRFGSMGIKALEAGRISSSQLFALKQTLNKYIKKNGKIFLNIFPHTPITRKAVKVRMGKGKGSVDHYVYKVKPGTIICEIETKDTSLAEKALRQGRRKISLLTKLITELNNYA